MPPFRYFRESAAPGRGEMGVAIIAGELIYANVRLRLTANRTYGLLLALWFNQPFTLKNHSNIFKSSSNVPFRKPNLTYAVNV